MEDLSGRQLGPYRVIAPLGEGGMAAVYRAEQPAMQREVALKVLPRQLAGDPEFVERFRREAVLLAKLQHPHILPVFDYGESGGFTYLAMPLVQGGTLKDLLAGAPLPLPQLVEIVSQVGAALDHAHRQGMVHRDVKPSNVLRDQEGNCLLMDFGIAKMYEGGSRLTGTGAAIGTPTYMSPEQGRGEKVDRRSDIYSLGVVLYELATGRAPFEAETPVAVIMKHISDPLPPPRRINPSLPPAVEQVILKALAKNPAGRYATAAEMVQALKEAAAGEGALPAIPVRQDGGQNETRDAASPRVQVKAGGRVPGCVWSAAVAIPLLVAGVVGVGLLGGLWLANAPVASAPRPLTPTGPPASTPASAAPVKPAASPTAALTPTTAPAGPQLTLVPSGRVVITSANAGEVQQIGRLERTGGSVSFSPDGSLLAVAGSGVYIYNTRDQSLKRKIEDSYAREAAFSPDGTILVAPTRDGYMLHEVDTGGVRGSWNRKDAGYFSWSPDGRLLAMRSEGKYVLVDSATGVDRCSLPAVYTLRLAFSPDGSLVAGQTGSAGGEITLWNPADCKALQTLKGHTNWITSIAFNRVGTRIVTTSVDKTVRLWDPAGRLVRTIEGHTGQVDGAAFSPDGRLLVTAAWDKTVKIWEVDSGKELKFLTGLESWGKGIAFYPDGTAFVSVESQGAVRIWGILTARGSAGRRPAAALWAGPVPSGN